MRGMLATISYRAFCLPVIHTCDSWDIRNYNSSLRLVWVRNLTPHTEARAQAESFREWCAEKKISEHMTEEVMWGRKPPGIKKLYDLTLHQILLRWLDKRGWAEMDIWYHGRAARCTLNFGEETWKNETLGKS